MTLAACSSDDGPPDGAGVPGGDCNATGATPAAVTAPTKSVRATATDVESAVKAAEDFLAILDSTQQEAVAFEFIDLDAKRCSWSSFPAAGFQDRQGVKLAADLTEEQRTAAAAVVNSLLSDTGSEMVQGIMTAPSDPRSRLAPS